LELGVETVPCLIAEQREGFTGNRMVNQLSASQEMRMLRKSLEELDEKTIASAFGMASIKHRLNQGLMKKLHERVVKAFEANKLNLQAAKELAHVKPERQAEILKLMESCNDYGVTFAKGLVLKTPISKRAKVNGAKTPWTKTDERKSDLLRRLREAEQQQDFYSGLYRQYTTNLLKLVIYVRSLLANARVREYLESRHGELAGIFTQILESTDR
jgi:ParB family chromosome partitioning protein